MNTMNEIKTLNTLRQYFIEIITDFDRRINISPSEFVGTEILEGDCFLSI